MDLRTLTIAALLVQLCCTLALYLISRNVSGMRGLRWFVGGYIAVAVGFALVVSAHGTGLAEIYIARVLYILCLVLMTQGFTEYTASGANSLRWGGALFLLFAAVEYYCIRPYPVVALHAFGVFFCAQALVCLLLLLSHREPGEREACATVAGLLGFIMLLIVARSVVAPLNRQPLNLTTLAHPTPLLLAGAGAYMMVIAGLAFGLVWMMAARLRNQLEQQARTDVLTGLLNRRALEADAQRELNASRNEQTPLAVLALDLDHFKQLNDTYGHAAGDVVLAAVGRLLAQCLRNSDRLARLGGEEFVAVLPARDAERAGLVAERLRSRLEELRVEYNGQRLAPTASFGIAMAEAGDNWASLLQRADAALYEAKRAGRNCIRTAPGAEGVQRHARGVAAASAQPADR